MFKGEGKVYHRQFAKEELSLLRYAIAGEIEFCKKQIAVVDDVEDDRNLLDRVHIRNKVVQTYKELIAEYDSLLQKLKEGYEE